jgi:hypothetical protein
MRCADRQYASTPIIVMLNEVKHLDEDRRSALLFDEMHPSGQHDIAARSRTMVFEGNPLSC